jgi:CheY-like chemotaxis protein
MLLRAELLQDSRHIVAHTTELSTTSAFIRTDERLDAGGDVELRLSFPRLFPPLRIDARVVSREAGSGHGYWPGFSLAFSGEHERLSRLLQAVDGVVVPSTYRMLVVEDSPTMREIMQHNAMRFSQTFRIEIVSAETAEQAAELLRDDVVDLAVVDLYLPGTRSGADLVRDLRARGIDLPVIGFSIGGAQARHAFLDAGADLFLDKPVMLRDMFATLERLVRTARTEP